MRTNTRAALPDRAACEAEGVSTLVIDLGAVVAVALETAPELCADEAWTTQQIVQDAPRT